MRSRGKVIPLGMYIYYMRIQCFMCAYNYVHTSVKLFLAADSPPQALLEAHSFIYKLITQLCSPETLYALDSFKVSTQHEYS